jgi:hypothetical protein
MSRHTTVKHQALLSASAALAARRSVRQSEATAVPRANVRSRSHRRSDNNVLAHVLIGVPTVTEQVVTRGRLLELALVK